MPGKKGSINRILRASDGRIGRWSVPRPPFPPMQATMAVLRLGSINQLGAHVVDRRQSLPVSDLGCRKMPRLGAIFRSPTNSPPTPRPRLFSLSSLFAADGFVFFSRAPSSHPIPVCVVSPHFCSPPPAPLVPSLARQNTQNYSTRRQSAGDRGPLFSIHGAPSLFHEYHRMRRRRLADARREEERDRGGGGGGGDRRAKEGTAAERSGRGSSSSSVSGCSRRASGPLPAGATSRSSSSSPSSRGQSPPGDGGSDGSHSDAGADGVEGVDDSEDNRIGARQRIAEAAAAETAADAAAAATMAGFAAGGRASSSSSSYSKRRQQALDANAREAADKEQESEHGKTNGEDDEDDDEEDAVEREAAARETERRGRESVGPVQGGAMVGNDTLQTEPKEDEEQNEGEKMQAGQSSPTASEECIAGGGVVEPAACAVDTAVSAPDAAEERLPGAGAGGARSQPRSTEQAHQEGGGEGGQTTAADGDLADGSSTVQAAAAMGPSPPPTEDAEMYYPLGPQPPEEETTARPPSALRPPGRRHDTMPTTGGDLSREELRDAKLAARERALELSGGKEPYSAEARAYMRDAVPASSAGTNPYDNGSSLEDDDEDFDSDSDFDYELVHALHESRQAAAQRMEAEAGPQPHAPTTPLAESAAAAAATAAAGEQVRAVGVAMENTAAEKERREGGNGGDDEDDDDDPMMSGGEGGGGGGGGDGSSCPGGKGWGDGNGNGNGNRNRMMGACLLDAHKVKAMFDDGYNETCPHFLSNLNWFLCLGGVEKVGARLAARPPPKAPIVRGLVEILCMVAEVVSNDQVLMLLRGTLTNLEAYIAGVSSEDLKRSPENRTALFGAMDHVRCA